MNDTQLKLLELMVHFDQKCRAFGIEYYLGGGSALGAIRHKGFLPWDDDVDLYITRANYEKLLDSSSQFFDDNFVLVNSALYPRYGNTVVRCVDTASTAITKARILDGTPKGQFVELFIMDPLPKDAAERTVWLKKHWVYTELVATAFRVANARVDKWVDRDLYEHYRARSEAEGKRTVLNELESELFCIEESGADEYCSRWGMRNLIYKIEWFGSARYVPFESTMLPVASQAERVLRFDYGDSWADIPDKDAQITHTFAESNTIGYEPVVEDYLRFIDPDETFATYAPRKKALMGVYYEYSNNYQRRREVKDAHASISAQVRLKKSDQTLNEMLQTGNWDSLRWVFETWLDYQVAWGYSRWLRWVNIDYEFAPYALFAGIVAGRYGKVADNISWMREGGIGQDRDDDLMSRVELLANTIRDAYSAIDSNDSAHLLSAIDGIAGCGIPHCTELFDYKYLHLYSLLDQPDVLHCDDEALLLAEELSGEKPNDGNVLALRAECELLCGNADSALLLFEEASTRTRNAFTLSKIKESVELLRGETDDD